MRVAFYKGVRLWEALEDLPAWAMRTGEKAHSGVRQRNQLANPQSPNFERPGEVRCYVVDRSPSAVPGYELGTAIENTLLAVETRLRDVSTSEGDLCFCEDHRRVAAVSGAEVAGGAVTVEHGAVGGGWVPAAGELVLFRNPVTKAGFHSTIASVGSGNVVCDLSQALTSAWRMVRVERVFPQAVYERMVKARARDYTDPELDAHEVLYHFAIYGDPVLPTASLLDHDTT